MKKPIVVCERRGGRSMHQIMLLRNGFWNSRFCMFENAQLKWAYFFCSINSVFCKERKLQFFLNRNLGHIFHVSFGTTVGLWQFWKLLTHTCLSSQRSRSRGREMNLKLPGLHSKFHACWTTHYDHVKWINLKKIKQKSKADMLDFHNLTHSICKQMQYINRVL